MPDAPETEMEWWSCSSVICACGCDPDCPNGRRLTDAEVAEIKAHEEFRRAKRAKGQRTN